MRPKILVVVLAIAVSTVAGCGDDDGRSEEALGPGLILCSEVGELGEALDGLIVVTPEGERVRTIGGGFLTPVWVPESSSRAVYFDSDAGAVLIDAETGSVVPLATEFYPTAPWFASRRFTVGRGTPWGGHLVDFESGTVVDLTEVLGFGEDTDLIPEPDFDADEEQLLLFNAAHESGAWLIPTSSPQERRRIAVGLTSAVLSDDGETVAYVAEGVGFVGPAAGGEFTTFGSDLVFVVWVQGGILAAGRGGVFLYEADGGGERVIFDPGDAVLAYRPLAGPAGRWALLAVEPPGVEDAEPGWVVVDGRSGEAAELGIVGRRTPLALAEGRALLASRSETFQGVGAFDRYEVVDPAAASVVTLAVPEDGLTPGPPSPDGLRHLFYGRDGWFLIDLPAASITSLPGDPQGASFSPDGERLVMAAWDGEDRANVDLVVAPVADPALGTELGVRCRNPLWVAGGG
jgi:hypothetical protein